MLPTPVFFYGMEPGEEISVDIERGKTLIIKFLTVGDPHADGTPHRVLRVERPAARGRWSWTRSLAGQVVAHPKAEPGNPLQIGAPMPGLVVRVAGRCRRRSGGGAEAVHARSDEDGDDLYAEKAARVAEVLVQAGTQVEAGDLLLRFQS